MSDSTDTSPVPASVCTDDQSTGFPALRTWPAVYLVVLFIFVTWVVLLTALSRAFR